MRWSFCAAAALAAAAVSEARYNYPWLPQEPYDCVLMTNTKAKRGRLYMLEQHARRACCEYGEDKLYYAVGGNWPKQWAWGPAHNNGWECIGDYDEFLSRRRAQIVSMTHCNLPCRGQDKDFNAAKSGYCGGGAECSSRQSRNCGIYRTVYQCPRARQLQQQAQASAGPPAVSSPPARSTGGASSDPPPIHPPPPRAGNQPPPPPPIPGGPP